MYGLEGVQSMIRGTLRYEGYSNLMRCFKALGLFSLEPLSPDVAINCRSWPDICRKFFPPEVIQSKLKGLHIPAGRILQTFEYLGILSSREPFPGLPTMLDNFCALLHSKLKYQDEERDLVVMQHELTTQVGNEKEYLSSSLVEYGQVGGFSAMARTVGYPVAVAAELILDGKVEGLSGVLTPTIPELYEPMLNRLEKVAGIKFSETSSRFPST
jgi:saccharopine dehydrogenase (NADP+, L-glutamate forming)